MHYKVPNRQKDLHRIDIIIIILPIYYIIIIR